jgi:hypothetical protein
MTVNELADYLFDITDCETSPYHQAATMLCKLDAENEALRKTVDSLFAGLESSIGLNKAQAERKVKELTDDEILDIWKPFDLSGDAWVYDEMLIGFTRAILRKTQEK